MLGGAHCSLLLSVSALSFTLVNTLSFTLVNTQPLATPLPPCASYNLQTSTLQWAGFYTTPFTPRSSSKAQPQPNAPSRQTGLQVGWFLHTPFPSSEIYRTLPVREEVLRAVLRADLIGERACRVVSGEMEQARKRSGGGSPLGRPAARQTGC